MNPLGHDTHAMQWWFLCKGIQSQLDDTTSVTPNDRCSYCGGTIINTTGRSENGQHFGGQARCDTCKRISPKQSGR